MYPDRAAERLKVNVNCDDGIWRQRARDELGLQVAKRVKATVRRLGYHQEWIGGLPYCSNSPRAKLICFIRRLVVA